MPPASSWLRQGYGPNNPLEVLIDGVPSGGLPEKADQAETILGYFRDVGIAAELDARDSATTRAISRVFGHTNRLTFMGSNIYETQPSGLHHHSGTTPRGGPEFRGLDEAITQQRSTVDPVKALDGLRNVGDVSFPLHIALPLFWVPTTSSTTRTSWRRTSGPECRLGVFHQHPADQGGTKVVTSRLRWSESKPPARAGRGLFLCVP